MNIKSKPTIRGIATLLLAAAALLMGQAQSDINLRVVSGDRPAIAVADMRGTGDAQRSMDTLTPRCGMSWRTPAF